MDMVNATLKLYGEALSDATQAFARSLWAIAMLAVFYAGFYVAALALAELDPAHTLLSGLVLAVLHAVGAGWYLALLEIAVLQRRNVRLDDVRDRMGRYVWDVLTVGFIFWIGELVLGPLLGASLWIPVLIATIVFNPGPELIYQGRSGGLELLRDAATFMQTNWPEWLGLHQIAAVGLALWTYLALGASDLTSVVFAVQMFGPWFGFVDAGSYAWMVLGPTPIAVLAATAILAFVHWFMLVRAFAYRTLGTSSRRGRAWQSRM